MTNTSRATGSPSSCDYCVTRLRFADKQIASYGTVFVVSLCTSCTWHTSLFLLLFLPAGGRPGPQAWWARTGPSWTCPTLLSSRPTRMHISLFVNAKRVVINIVGWHKPPCYHVHAGFIMSSMAKVPSSMVISSLVADVHLRHSTALR